MPIRQHRVHVHVMLGTGAHVFDDVVHGDDGVHSDAEFAFDIGDRGRGAVAALLPVYADEDAGGVRIGVLEYVHDLADGGSGGNDVVDDQEPACRLGSHK